MALSLMVVPRDLIKGGSKLPAQCARLDLRI